MSEGFSHDNVQDYDGQCAQGLKYSGESRLYFAKGRLSYLQKWWSKAARKNPEVIIDYGCGTGEITSLLATLFPYAQVIGCDVSPACVTYAKQHYASEWVSFQLISDGKIQCPPAQLIHSNGVVHHIPLDQRDSVFKSLGESLTADGILALFENNPINPGTRLVMAKIPFDRDAIPVNYWEVRNRMHKANLLPINIAFLFYFPSLLSFLRPLERCLVKLPLGAQYAVFAHPVNLAAK